MYFKVEKSGCLERKGLVQVRYDLYLEKSDNGYDKYKDDPFHYHFVQFDPTVTDEEILYVGELTLNMAFRNIDNYRMNKNMPFVFKPELKVLSEKRLEKLHGTDFANIKTEYKYKVK